MTASFQRPGRCSPGRAIAIVLAFFFVATFSRSQEVEVPDIVKSYNETLKALGAGDHEAALTLCNSIINEYGTADEGKEEFGTVYGHWFYLRGLALMGLEKWEQASADFETCYQCTYETPKVLACKNCRGLGRVGVSSQTLTERDEDGKVRCPDCGGIPYNPNHPPNLFRMHALAQWGNCRMILEDYAKAREIYQRALSEDRRNRLNANWKLYIAVNMGRCMIKTGAVDEGYDFIVRALDAERFPLPIKMIVFQILAEDWSPLVSADRTREFLDQYRHIALSAPSEERAKRDPSFFFLANGALEKNDPMLALSWYRMLSHPGQIISEFNETIELYTARKKSDPRPEIIPRLDEEIAELTKARDLVQDNFWSMQAGLGIAHYRLNNYAASLSVYKGLADFAPKTHKGRPEFLHNAVFSGVKIDDWKSAYQYGMDFLDEFPNHELKPAVVRVLVEMIFIQGNYQRAYEIAKEVRVDMEPGSAMREIPDFVVGASAYQLGHFDEADTELTQYLATYEPAQRRELALFFLGSVKVKKYDWQAGTDLFDPFLEEFPQSAMESSVLYQNGMSKFMLSDYENALVLIDRLLSEYPGAQEVPGGWNLRGDIQSTEEADFGTEISPAYNNAISTSANFPDQEEIAAYAMWQLLMNTASLERWEEAGQWFDRFQSEHPESAYSVDALIGALDTLVALGRIDEASQRLETLLYTSGQDAAGGQLAELFGSYLDFIKENDPENAATRLDEMGLSRQASVALKAWAKIGEIQLLEETKGDHEDAIQALFYQLNNNFDPAPHSNYIIVRLARWHAVTRKQPAEAAPLYDYILANREGSEDFDLALLDRAEIDAKSELPEDRARARQYFDRVLNEFANAELAENASVGVARLLMKDKQFEEALTRWEAYMDNNAWNKFSAEANYNYGVCLDQLGQVGEALVVYINTYNAYPGHIEVSMPAYIRAALIMKEKGEDLKAMLILKDMLTRMKDIEHPNKDKAMQLFLKWRSEYVPPKEEAAK